MRKASIPPAALLQIMLGAGLMSLGALALLAPESAARLLGPDAASPATGWAMLLAGLILDGAGVAQLIATARRRPDR